MQWARKSLPGTVKSTHMKYRCTLLALAIAPGTSSPVVLANGPEQSERLGDYILQMPALTTRPIVDHCTAKKPDIANEIEAEYAAFMAKLMEAGRPLHERLASEPGFAGPVPIELKKEVSAVGEAMLARVRELDPGRFCPTMMTRMRETSIELLRNQIEQSYLEYLRRTQARSSGQ